MKQIEEFDGNKHALNPQNIEKLTEIEIGSVFTILVRCDYSFFIKSLLMIKKLMKFIMTFPDCFINGVKLIFNIYIKSMHTLILTNQLMKRKKNNICFQNQNRVIFQLFNISMYIEKGANLEEKHNKQWLFSKYSIFYRKRSK